MSSDHYDGDVHVSNLSELDNTLCTIVDRLDTIIGLLTATQWHYEGDDVDFSKPEWTCEATADFAPVGTDKKYASGNARWVIRK